MNSHTLLTVGGIYLAALSVAAPLLVAVAYVTDAAHPIAEARRNLPAALATLTVSFVASAALTIIVRSALNAI